MPGKVGVKIKAARNLPVMDKSSETTDAFVEIKLANKEHKTEVFRKSLNPTWNTDWFRFEVDDAELQDEPLQIRLMDYDTYSANDAIGKVNISLNPLCLENSSQAVHGKGTVLSGWIPVFDTMHGIRGEINVIVKVDLFSDVNKFRQSSCGIPFFHSQCVPFGYRAQVIHGFVEELVVNDDPEYQWIDKIRTPRASNEARQVVFLRLSGQVQRKMGLKAINMGANAVIGYTQCFDLEGDVGVVARGVGTAVTLMKDTFSSQPTSADVALIEEVQKYIDFLNCAGGSSGSLGLMGGRSPQYKLNIYKQPAEAAAAAATMFYLESGSSDTEDADAMQNLLRQEDERGECGERTREKKLRHRMRRLTMSSRNVFSEKYATLLRRIEPKIPENATQSLSNIFGGGGGGVGIGGAAGIGGSKRYRKSRYSLNKRTFPLTIVRSVSNNESAVPAMSQLAVPRMPEHQENSHSAPDLDVELNEEGFHRKCEYSTDSTESLSFMGTLATVRQRRSTASTDSEDDENESLHVKEDDLQDNWIKPGETRSCENSQLDLTPKRPTLLEDLKSFSRRLQQLMHLTPKSRRPVSKRSLLFANAAPEHKSYYCSQPELPTCQAEDWLTPSVHASASMLELNHLSNYEAPIRRSASLSHFTSLRCLNTGLDIDSVTTGPIDVIAQPYPTLAPALCVCPSTPTPTDSEHISQLSRAFVSYDPPQFKLDLPVNISNSTNHGNNNISSLLAPCYSVSPSTIQNQQQLRPSRSSSDLQQQQQQPQPQPQPQQLQQPQQTPSPAVPQGVLIPTTIATLESSGNCKKFASPIGIDSNRLKLTPSPSKSGISSGANADSASTSTTSTATTMVPAKEVGEICRRSSDSDLSVTPKGNSICVTSDRLAAATAMMRLTTPTVGGKTTDSMDMLEYPFLTMTKYPMGFILHLGATVAARSVKLLERVPNPDEPEVRDSWWTELRMEIRSHARSLGCNVVLGYAETTTISDDVCVLSATGTAAVINMVFNRSVSQTDILAMSKASNNSLEERDANGSLGEATAGAGAGAPPSVAASNKDTGSLGTTNSSTGKRYGLPSANAPRNTCAVCHVPYNLSSVPFNVKMKKCAICRKGRVPDVLLATLEVPEHMQVSGRGCFMQAQVVRAKRDLRAELNAKEISDGLPFLEYELHRVLINKLKAKGMNAIFGLRTQVAIGERMIALIATGTALFLTALPVPQVPKIVAGNSWTDKQKLNELQKKLQETFERNQEIYQLKSMDPDLASANNTAGGDKQSDTDESDDEEINEIDLNCGNKELCVLEVDDIEDLEIISLLMEPYPPEGFHVVNTQQVPGMQDLEAVKNLQMFTQVWRARLEVGQNVNGFPKHFQRLLQTIYFKLRTMIPCAICDLRFRLDLPETDQIQLLVTGMAMGLSDGNKIKYRRRGAPTTLPQNGFNDANVQLQQQQFAAQSAVHVTQSQPELNGKRMLQEEDYIFPLDEDQMVDTPTPTSNVIPPFGMSSFKSRKTSPSRLGNLTSALPSAKSLNVAAVPRSRYFPLRDRYGVDLTPLSFIPGGRIEKYLGNLNFFFIRESTSIRENGGISGFVHGFITELLAVVRAHIASLGGNAMVSFYLTELILFDNQHKNQGQCLISIGGDAVYVSYYADD